jgi:hypothetical protein
MIRLIENYINGNLADAKRQAKRYSVTGIRKGLLDYGYTLGAAVIVADYLKGHATFEEACRAENPFLTL